MTFLQTMLTPINQRHRIFWAEQHQVTDSLLKYEVLYQHAASNLRSEVMRGTPTRSQSTLEQALRDAFALRQELAPQIRSDTRCKQVSIAESAKKTDPLQELTLALARKDPKLTVAKLLHRLKREQHCGVIEDIDQEKGRISFKLRTGDIKSASIRGLKDRLSRAKKTITMSQITRTPPSKAAPANKKAGQS